MAYAKMLSKMEIESFDSPPNFDAAVRKQYFNFPKLIINHAAKMKSLNEVYFLVGYGYFKACQKFYFGTYKVIDIDYVASSCDIPSYDINDFKYKERTFRNHRKFILTYLGYNLFNNKLFLPFAMDKIKIFSRSQERPRNIFFSLITDILNKNLSLPLYSTLEEIIRQGIDGVYFYCDLYAA